jgi:hypothetical protein
MQYYEQGVRVGSSAYGLGVFALRPFSVHEMIGPIQGTVFEDPQYESEYCMELGHHSALEPDSPFRYVNHSCHPNCELVEVTPEAEGEAGPNGVLWLKVLAQIVPDEQLTIDYAWPACVAVPCACGSAECRGWIVAEEDRDILAPASPGLLALMRTPRRHRHHVRRLYRLWTKWNQKFFAGKLVVPAIVLSRSGKSHVYGVCGPTSDPGSLSQIRLQLSLLTGTDEDVGRTRKDARYRYRLAAEVLLHEMVHQWGREVAGDDDRHWRHHGTSFCQKCNDIGRQLRLLPVSSARDASRDPALASCSRWPHNARRVAAARKAAVQNPF